MSEPIAVTDILWVIGGLFVLLFLAFVVGWLKLESQQDRWPDRPLHDGDQNHGEAQNEGRNEMRGQGHESDHHLAALGLVDHDRHKEHGTTIMMSVSSEEADLIRQLRAADIKIGDRVEKFTGEARYKGQVRSAYTTRRGGIRFVVEVEPQGFQMICTSSQLRKMT